MNQQNAAPQPEVVHDPTTQALHRVLARIYGHNGAEEDPSFVEIRRRCKERLRLSDIISAPLIQEVSTDETTIVNAIKTYPGFFVRNDQVKQHHDFMPQNSVLMRDMPANFSNAQLIEMFQSLVLEDGSPCPMPIPEKIRSDGNTWLAVFASVEDAEKSLAPVRNKVLDGKNIRAVLRNESTRLQPMNSNYQKRDGMVPMMYNPAMAAVPNSYPGPMYGQTTVISGHQPMYYAPPQATYQYYPYPQPPAFPMAHYGMPMAYSLPQSPYAPAAPYGYDMSMYGVPTSPTMQNGGNNMYNNNGNNANNNNNKPRRNNNQYVNNNGNNNNYNNNNHRQNAGKPRDSNRYARQGEEAMVSPSGVTATEVAVAALDSQTSVPRSFSADADDAHKQPEVAVPVISVPSSEVAETPVAAGVHDATISATNAEDAAASGSSDDAAEKDNEKSPRNGRKDGKRDGNRGDRKDGKRDGKEGDRRGNGRDAKGRQEKDGKKERKTPPVTLSLEKDFPTLQLGDNAKTAAGGKVAFNYANALKKPTDESPKPVTSSMTNKSTSSNNNANNNNKKDSRSSSKGSSPNPTSRPDNETKVDAPTTTTATTAAPTVATKKTKTEAPAVVTAPVVTVPETVKVPEKASVPVEPVPISPSAETTPVETEQTAGAKKAFSFIDAVRAKK